MTGGCEWSHAAETCVEDFGDLRKVRELSSYVRTEESSFSVRWRRLTFRASPRPCGGCRTWFGADGNVVIERLCISVPYVEKPLNSKVIKSFVPELRSRKCFSCFRIPMLSIYVLWTLWKFCVPVWICLFHIFMYGYVTESFDISTKQCHTDHVKAKID